jgi:phosphatidylserine/phosphatidylglycerophosphate/cardiolipin synthase-like enzyme
MPFREHRYGFTAFSPCRESVDAGRVTAFVSPDCGLSSVVTAIDGASRVIRLCSYEFSSDAVCTALAKALWRGVLVRILVDGAPAGGMTESQLDFLSILQDSGADVRILLGNLSQKIVQHVGPLHAKYMVLDDSGGVVMSENFVESGLPGDPYEGNRGWGVAFENGRLAQYLACLFDEDSRSSRQDVRRWADDPRYAPGLSIAWSEGSAPSCGIFDPYTTTAGSRVTIVPSPDCSLMEPFIAPMIAGAERFLVEQFQADLLWRDRWTGAEPLSPLLTAVEHALEGGANGSVLLDPTWFNAEHNSEVAEHINEYASSRGLLGEAKLMDSSGPSKTLHNKGLVLDGSITVVSSNNWGVSSFARNRELAVIIESTEVAGYFEAAFKMDWEPDIEPPQAIIGNDISALVGETVLLNGSWSSDDRGIARWTWALDGEGLLVADGPDARFCAARPGTYLVRLSVRDAWGNMDSAVVSIEVLPSDGARSMLARVLPFVAASVSAIAGAGLGVLIARKLNHHNRGSR